MIFTLILGLLIGSYACLMFFARIPANHDGLQYLTLQYYFLNHMANYGEYPHWMPFMTLGTVSSWWYAIQAGFVANAQMLLGTGIKSIPFYVSFYAGMFLDELILMVGCWLLGRRYLKNDLSVAFYCLAMGAGSIWAYQPWYNLHSYYCLPLILHFLHTFLETGRWRFFLGGCHLILMQMLGNMPYFIPLQTLIVFLYFALFAVVNPDIVKRFWQCVRWDLKAGACLLFLGGTAYLIYTATGYGAKDIVMYIGRESDGTSSLVNFLKYGGEMNLHKWKELIFGFAAQMNYHLYGGIMIVPLIVWGLIHGAKKAVVPLVILIVVLLDFSAGGLTAVVSYHAWPLMKYFRHLALIAPMIKVFVFLIAAIGFDWFVTRSSSSEYRQKIAFLPAGILLVFAVGQFTVIDGNLIDGLIRSIQGPGRLYQDAFVDFIRPLIADRLIAVTVLTILSAAAWGAWASDAGSRKRKTIILLIFCVHLLDVGIYKFEETKWRTATIKPYEDILDYQPFKFTARREPLEGWENSRRAELFKRIPWWPNRSHYWSDDSFLMRDAAGNAFRTDHILFPLDQLLRAYGGQDIHDRYDDPVGLHPYRNVELPAQESASKWTGVSEDKIQFFSDAFFVKDENAMAKAITAPNYRGDIPIVMHDEENASPNATLLEKDARMRLPYTVKEINANRLALSFESPQEGWMTYSEVWHPYWEPKVNGQGMWNNYRTNLAFNAVPISKGSNEVVFSFDAGWMDLAQKVLSFFSLIWIIVIGVLCVQTVRAKRSEVVS